MAEPLPVARKNGYPWPFYVAMLVTLLLFFSFQALFPTLPLYISAIGGSLADNGLATWVFALAALLMRPLAGVLADRWGRKPVLLLGAILFGGGPMLHAFAFNVPSLLVMRAVHGVGMALFSTAYQAFIADLLPHDRYGEGLGLANVASTVAMVVAPLVGERLVGEFGFRTSFQLFSAVGGVGAVIALILPRHRSGVGLRASGQEGMADVLQQPGVRAGAVGMMLLGIPFGAFIVFVPLLADARGLGGAGGAYAIYALATSIAQPVAGRVADRLGAARTGLAGLALAGLGSVGLAGAAEAWMLWGASALFGIGSGVAQAGFGASVQGSVGPSLRGKAAAVQFTAFDLLVGFGSWALGSLAAATGYGVMYGAVGAIVLLGAAAGGLAWRRRELA